MVDSGKAGLKSRTSPKLKVVVSVARFLQWVFRGLGWMRTQRVGPVLSLVLLLWMCGAARPHRCGRGENLAGAPEFEAQRARAEACLDWYAHYPAVLRRLQSGVTPMVTQTFCGGGGSTEGVRRAGGASVGVDLRHQSDFVRRLGAEAFKEFDCMDTAKLRALDRSLHALGCMASPPCQFYSVANVSQKSSEPALITQTRDLMAELWEYTVIENVKGARKAMSKSAVKIHGALFGLQVSRPRLFESSFRIHVDEALSTPADKLRIRCCLGERKRWRPKDIFGRGLKHCCEGNIYTVVGSRPFRCTHSDCALAMGCDPIAMSYERLAQSIPPVYAQLIFCQMCMAAAHRRFGAPSITFDDMLRNPPQAKRALAF